jgi:hypothetical protein
MNSFPVASLALVLVAALGTPGCGYRERHVRYGYMPMRARMLYVPQAAPAVVAPPVEAPVEAPPAPMAPPQGVYGGQPIIVRAQGPGPTIIVINPPQGAPAVGVVQGAPPPAWGQAPAAPPPQAPRPQLPPQANPGGWEQD